MGQPHDTVTLTSKRLRPARVDAQRPRWRLHLVASGDPAMVGAIVEVAPGETVVGRQLRSSEAPGDSLRTLKLADAALSRRHVALRCDGSALEAVDLGSHNGTFLNGVGIEGHALASGDVVRAGDSVMVVELDPGTNAACDAPSAEVPGRSAMARALRAALSSAARDGLPVLVQGASGVGKEMAAAALHRTSGRRGALVRLNATAVPEALFESEMFGHVRGAFTGASAATPGRFREANGGTLVLDEIGDLPLAMQPKLLRVLEEGRLRPVGGSQDEIIDVKVVATTHVDLVAAVAAGRFRHDLLARLRGHEVTLPPLSARRADLLALADAVHKVAWGRASWGEALDADAVELLLLADWPDNLRSLRGLLARLAVGAAQPPIGVADLPVGPWSRKVAVDGSAVAAANAKAGPTAATGETEPPRHVLSQAPPRAELEALLRRHGGQVQPVAAALGRDRRQVYRWLASVGLGEAEMAQIRAQAGGEKS